MVRYENMYNGGTVPRPPYWGGYMLIPDRFEFWKEGKDRLHERIRYEKDGGRWNSSILAP